MTLTEQVYAQAALLAGKTENPEILNALCVAATAALTARLKEGLYPEDCKADFVAAASLFALAGLSGVRQGESPEQIAIGDLTVRKSGDDTASRVLYHQAELMIAPYLKDRFTFAGV